MQPGQFNPKGEDWIGREFAALRQEIRELKAANPYAPMGMRPMLGGVEFTGNMRVAGTLDLPAGIIGNDALANPVTGKVFHASAFAFELPVTTSGGTRMLTQTVLVPEGFTRAMVMATADMTATNSTALDDYAFLDLQISGEGPTYVSGADTRPGRYSFVGSSYAREMTGLGPSFDVTVDAGTDRATWTADPDANVVNLNIVVTFLR